MKDEREQMWGDFFRKYQRIAVRYAFGITKDKGGAEDTFQEAAAAVYRQLAEGRVVFESPLQFRSYFFKTVKNLAINWTKRREREPFVGLEEATTAPSEHTPLEDILKREAADEDGRKIECVLNCLKRVRKREREVIVMRFFQQLSYNEISHRTNVPLSTVRYRERSVLKKMRKKLKKFGF